MFDKNHSVNFVNIVCTIVVLTFYCKLLLCVIHNITCNMVIPDGAVAQLVRAGRS